MEIFHNLIFGFSVALSWQNLFYCFLGCFLGTLIGVLPGIGPLATIAMLMPITFAISPVAALIMLAGIYYGAQYGGSTTSILVNLPGETSSVVTCIDGYQMARQGRAGPALAIAAIGSFFAGTVCTLVIAMFGPPIAEMALKFASPEYFSLMTMGLIVAAVLAPGDMVKSMAMVFLGLLLGCIGTDVDSGWRRFSFDIIELTDGIGFVVVAIGVFALGEIVANLGDPEERTIFTSKEPKPEPHEVKIKVKAAGVCGSEVHAYNGTHPFRHPPAIMGHELAGEVVEVGSLVRRFQAGDRVVAEPQKTCGVCLYCQSTDYYLCRQKVVLGTTTWNGAFGEYVTAPEKIVYPLPDNMSFEEGALVEPLAVGLHAVRQSSVQIGSSVVIIGSGTIGLATMACAKAQGAGHIIAADVIDFNLETAKKMGATRVVNVKKEKLAEIIKREVHPEGVEIGFDAAGYPAVVDDLLSVTRRKGEIEERKAPDC